MKNFRSLLLISLLAAGAGHLRADLVLDPSPGDLSAIPGATVGWGFSFTNDTAYYLEFSSSQFCLDPVLLTPLLSCTSPATGIFNDILVNNDPIIAPGDTLTESFDAVGFTTGLGYFQIDPAAIISSVDQGQIVLTYDGYGTDPSVDPNAVQYLFDVPVEAEASVGVTPEPSSASLIVLAALLVLAVKAFAYATDIFAISERSLAHKPGTSPAASLLSYSSPTKPR